MSQVSSRLTADAVEAIFKACLLRDGEEVLSPVEVEGARATVRFHGARLWENMEAIIALLAELPDNFSKSQGGASFLFAFSDRHGNRWAGTFDGRAEELFLLGQAIGMVSFKYPREAWGALWCGQPFYIIENV